MRDDKPSAMNRTERAVKRWSAAAIVVSFIMMLSSGIPTHGAKQALENVTATQPETDVRVIDSNPVDELVLKIKLDTAQRALARGAFEEAETLYRRVLEQDPNNPDACAGLGAAMLRQGRTAEAMQQLETCAENHPDDARVPLALGQTYLEDQKTDEAFFWLHRARNLDSHLPDVDYYLGTATLQDRRPLEAYQTLSQAEPSNQQMAWARELAMGAALAQLGLQEEASEHFTRVRNEAGQTALGQQAEQLQTQLDDALKETPRLRGSFKATTRYDNNPGVVPSTDVFGQPQTRTDTGGHLFTAQLDYDLYRAYNFSLTTGYALMGTANHETNRFNLLDNAAYLSAAKRTLWHDVPVRWGLRGDYDHLMVNSNTFLSRTAVTPSLTIQKSDRTATTLLCRFTDYNFISQRANANTPFDQDSDDWAMGIFQQHVLPRSNASLTYGYQHNQNQSRGSNYDHKGHRFLLGAKWRWAEHWELNVSNWFYYRGYENPHSTAFRNRLDRQYTLQVGLRRALTKQLDVLFEYLYDRNHSNISGNNYHRQLVEIGLEYRFGAPVR